MNYWEKRCKLAERVIYLEQNTLQDGYSEEREEGEEAWMAVVKQEPSEIPTNTPYTISPDEDEPDNVMFRWYSFNGKKKFSMWLIPTEHDKILKELNEAFENGTKLK